MRIKSIKNVNKQLLSNHLTKTITNFGSVQISLLTIVDTTTMKVKIGNIWYGASNTSSTNPSNVIPFTKIIYLEHANFSGFYDPERDINTKSGLNYYHYKQTNPNDYSLQEIFVNESKITDTDKVCFILSPGVWKAQSPNLVSPKYTSYGNRYNGFSMWNENSCLIGFGVDKTTIHMNNYVLQNLALDASCICLPSSSYSDVFHSYNYINFIFTGNATQFISSGVNHARNNTNLSLWQASPNSKLQFDNCILNFNVSLSYTNKTLFYCNGGTFSFNYTTLLANANPNYNYVNYTTTFKRVSPSYTLTLTRTDFNYWQPANKSQIFNNLSSTPQIRDITAL